MRVPKLEFVLCKYDTATIINDAWMLYTEKEARASMVGVGGGFVGV